MSEQQRVAVIVAGGSGMGAAAARKLHEAGFAIGILSSSGKGEALAHALGGVGVTGSNQNVADLQKLVDAVVQRWGLELVGAVMAVAGGYVRARRANHV